MRVGAGVRAVGFTRCVGNGHSCYVRQEWIAAAGTREDRSRHARQSMDSRLHHAIGYGPVREFISLALAASGGATSITSAAGAKSPDMHLWKGRSFAFYFATGLAGAPAAGWVTTILPFPDKPILSPASDKLILPLIVTCFDVVLGGTLGVFVVVFGGARGHWVVALKE